MPDITKHTLQRKLVQFFVPINYQPITAFISGIVELLVPLSVSIAIQFYKMSCYERERERLDSGITLILHLLAAILRICGRVFFLFNFETWLQGIGDMVRDRNNSLSSPPSFHQLHSIFII